VTDDRAARQDIENFLSDLGGSGVVQGIPGNADSFGEGSAKSPRARQLRPTFRPTPTESTGFPGTRAFSSPIVSKPSRRSDSRAAGATVQPAAAGPVGVPTNPKRADDSPGRRAPLQQAGGRPQANQSTQPEDERDIRGWGRGPSGANSAAVGSGGGAARLAVAKGDRSGSAEPGAAADQPTPKRPGRPKKDQAPAIPAAIAKLVPKSDEPKVPPKLIPTEAERADARHLFREIGQRFNENRKKSKTSAYAGFRHDLMDNLDTLVMGGAIDLKEATTIITNLEQFTKETEAESTETPATILGRWLRMDAAEIAGLVPAEEVVEAVEDGEEEDSGEEVEQSDIF